MELQDEALLQAHLDNGELKSLWHEHLKMEQQLDKINRKPYLTPIEKAEKKRLQFTKLQGKTRIETILNQYRA